MTVPPRYTAAWAHAQALSLLAFHDGTALPAGGFAAPGLDGTPQLKGPRGRGPARPLHETCRMVHAYAIGQAMGHPGAAAQVAHGMKTLFENHHDPRHGGFWWSFDDAGPLDTTKQAYGHAFVLLAAASAQGAGHPQAGALRDLARAAIRDRFWEESPGAVRDSASEDWQDCPAYRGQNANMHLTEALLASHAAWGDPEDLHRALGIAELIINRHARACGWVVAEHFDSAWQIDRDYDGDAMFRPSGTTPGHALEWSRLLLELHAALPAPPAWLTEAAEALFTRAMAEAWRPEGGLAYTLDWSGAVSRDWRFWWPCAEAIAAAATLFRHTGDSGYDAWHQRLLEHADRVLIDHARGGWFHQVDSAGRPLETLFPGKPDIYHALTALTVSASGFTPGKAGE
ncbi:AGE family epimerase/isomerase [Pseudooceanicola sp. CBS1P-1]|uniref:AGE family epimerase/isomerase n=1 Tax=Pseudooceanicola albus TaxID=2692189 RepID=A0A6L7G0H4_9RHOB|nr:MULTISPECIES: AGE family epimerase/isomerase [Pseudooceanicola]MBT9382653.1 AGE family epimerase/isomerase [Pseudooceanicola endophyticus]MXN17192.1 AGE family epimerase/isomerase [Pseudooceanicola albus]